MDSNKKEIVELKYWVTILYQIMEMNKGFTPSDKDLWLIDCESLLQKIAFHSLTVLDLTEGTKPSIPSIKSNINFTDYFSIHSIVRTALEAFLVFYYVFQDKTVGSRVKKIRYKIWHASSLSQRQRQNVLTGKMKQLLKREKSDFLKLRREILKSKTLLLHISLPNKNKLNDKKSFDWKPNDGWRGIAKLSPLSEYYWVDIYNSLSSHAHSSAVITHQLQNNNPKELQEGMSLVAISFLNLMIPLLIEGYGEIFPPIKRFLDGQKDLMFKIDIAKGVVSSYRP